MTWRRFIRRLVIPVILVAAFFQCTENPIEENVEITSTRNIEGRVVLSSGNSVDSVYAWLEGFNIGTFSDGEGNFNLVLPAPASQPGGGLSGDFTLYFYIHNYSLDSAEIILKDGELLPAQADINDDGKLKEDIVLEPLVNVVSFTVEKKWWPEQTPIPFNYAVVLIFTTVLQADNQPVEVLSFGGVQEIDFVSSILVSRINDSEEINFLLFNSNATDTTRIIGSEPRTFITRISSPRCILPIGEYELTPFIWVRQTGVPAELLETLGVLPETFGFSYLDLPFLSRQSTTLEIGRARSRDLDFISDPCL